MTIRFNASWLLRPTILIFIAVTASFLGTVAAAKTDKFVIYGYAYEHNDSTGYSAVDSFEVSLTRSDSIVMPFRLLSEIDSTGLSKSKLRVLVEGPRDTYQLRLYKPGYEPLLNEVRYSAANRDIVYADNLQFVPEKLVELEGIEVQATAIKMVMKGDTIVYNASAFQLSEGSMLESLIAMLPGAEITAEGQIKVNGRVLNELLINGKDFFSGDPNVAMKNLPSYTVDKVKVYDKAAKDAYLTQSDVKLSKKEDEENLVMDVVLKKEYNRGYMANLEAGYGLNDRYLGRLFGLMFTDNLRISAFGNFNNVKDGGTASTDGQWRNSFYSPGNSEIQMGGLDLLFDKKLWQVNAAVKAERSESDEISESANVNYYDSGDIYSRADSHEHSVGKKASFNGSGEYRGDAVYLRFSPNVEYSTSRGSTVSRRATFNRQPEGEQSRTESLDSLFSTHPAQAPSRFEQWLLNRNSTVVVTNPRFLYAHGALSATIRPEKMSGSLNISAKASHSRSDSDNRSVYYQTLGPEAAEGTEPVRRDTYSQRPSRDTDATGTISYRLQKNRFTDTRKRSITLAVAGEYNHKDKHNTNDYWLATGDNVKDLFSQTVVLPSLTEPDNALIDTQNTYATSYRANDLTANARFEWRVSQLVETDSGINPEFSIKVSITDRFINHHGTRSSAEASASRLLQRNHLSPEAGFHFSSGNKRRYMTVDFNYRMGNSSPDVFSLIPATTNANPFDVIERGMEKLKDSRTHDLNASFGRYGRTGRMTGLSLFGGWSATQNAIGAAKRYDPATGISYTRSVNVNGNRSAYFYTNVWTEFGKDNKWSWDNNLWWRFNRSVDFVTATSGQPVKSLVFNNHIYEKMTLSWNFGKGSHISVNGSVTWDGARSPRQDFNEVNVWTFGGGLSGTVRLPLDFEISTSLKVDANRGYESDAMNRETWHWNASASKSILKGKLTFKLTAVDILNQVNNNTITINAQGRYESWTNTTPSYAMLSVIYRFNHNPKDKKK